MAHELIGWRTIASLPFGIASGSDTKNNRSPSDKTHHQDQSAEMYAYRQDQGRMGDCIADIVEIGPEPAADIQLGSQYAIKVVHRIIEND